MESLRMLPHHLILYSVSRFYGIETSTGLTKLFNLIDEMTDETIVDLELDASSGGDSVCKPCLKRRTKECVSESEAEQQLASYILIALGKREGDILTVRDLRYIARNESLARDLNGDFAMVALRLSQKRARR